MKLFIRMDLFPFFCKYIYFLCEHLDCKCVYRMCGRNVLQIGMYPSVELWGGSHFFIYIGNYIILFMFVLLHCYRFLFFCFLGWRPQLFTSFVLSCSSLSSWRRRVHAAILKKPISNLRMSSLQSLSDALMPKVMYIVWTTFKVLSLFRSVFVTESVLALSKRAAISNRR